MFDLYEVSSSHKQKIDHVLNNALAFILRRQQQNGAIPWFDEGKLDPWDHTESIIALCIGKKYEAAKKGFLWLADNQNCDGTWFAKYLSKTDDKDADRQKIDTNFVAYPATGLWAYYLSSHDTKFIHQMYPTVKKALNYVLSQQTTEGDIQWANSSDEDLPRDALVTACSSILRSLECGIFLADICHDNSNAWEQAYHQLADALKNKPWRFDRTWESKDRFSMDWFYPILSGIYSPEEAKLRLKHDWDKFVEPQIGCRCVSDEPWVTIAESCELVMSLVNAQERIKAEEIFLQLLQWQDDDGGFWTGYVYKDKAIWPQEKTTWTAAAIIMAADALYNISPASPLLTSQSHLVHLGT